MCGSAKPKTLPSSESLIGRDIAATYRLGESARRTVRGLGDGSDAISLQK
jgi:hypothetical protein